MCPPEVLSGRAAGCVPLVNPVLVSVILLAALLWVSDTPYPVYLDGAQVVHFMLGPATVALAAPHYANLPLRRGAGLAIAAARVAGSVTANVSALGISKTLGVRGFAVGVAAHGIGIARALQVNERAGAFAGIGMGLNAVLTALIAPWVLALALMLS